MRILLLALLMMLGAAAQAQDGQAGRANRDALGIRLDAPQGVHQYAFRIGEWESTFKSLTSRTEWDTGAGHYRVYVAENGLTFVEEGLDEAGDVTHRITFDYDEDTNSWSNHFVDTRTGREVDYTSRMVDGSLVEIIQRADNVNRNTYTEVGDGVYIYTARRTYGNGFTLVNHVGISTRLTDGN